MRHLYTAYFSIDGKERQCYYRSDILHTEARKWDDAAKAIKEGLDYVGKGHADWSLHAISHNNDCHCHREVN